MIKDILAEYEKMEIKLPNWIKQYPKNQQEDYRLQTKQEWLADKLTKYFIDQHANWNRGKTEAIALVDGIIFVLQQHPSRVASKYYGGLTFNYILIIFEAGEAIFTLQNFCDEPCYDSLSFKIPVMDLYDVAISGQRRKPKV